MTQDDIYLAHGLGVSDRGGEVPIIIQTPKEAAPSIVAVGCIWQAPGHQWLTLQDSSAVLEQALEQLLCTMFDSRSSGRTHHS